MISVALCTYNGEKFIRQQLDSILAQTISVDEIVVFDDGSIDATIEILKDYSIRYSLIKLFQNPTNVGYKKNFELALAECNGDFIFLSDQDDVWKPDKVEISINYLKATKLYGAFSDANLIDQNGAYIGVTLFHHQNLHSYIDKSLLQPYMFEILCLRSNFVTGATLVVTKAAKELILPFRTSNFMAHDCWIAMKLASKNLFGYIDTPLMSYRIHSNQQAGLDLSNTRKRDTLVDIFLGKGDLMDAFRRRSDSAAAFFTCKFGKEERCKLFVTYHILWKLCSRNSTGFVLWKFVLFYLGELIFFLKLKIGYRL